MRKFFLLPLLLPTFLFPQPTVQFSRLPSATVHHATDRLATDSLGRIYALQGTNVVRLASFGAVPEIIPTGFTALSPVSLMVLEDGLVYLSGSTVSSGPDRCGTLPGTVNFLGTPLPAPVGTVFLTRLDLRSSPSLPTVSACAHTSENSAVAFFHAVSAPGPAGTFFLASNGQPSFPLGHTFGPPSLRLPTGWIAKLDANLTLMASAGLSAVDGVMSVTAGKDKVAIGGYTRSSLFPQQGSLPGPLAGGLTDGFIAVFSDNLSTFLMSSRIGGSGDDVVTSVAFDETGSLYFGGTTESTNLNVVNGYQLTLGGGRDVMYGRITPTLRHFQYFSYLGGADDEIIPKFALLPGGAGVRLAFDAGITPDTLLTVNPLAGSPKGFAVVAHLSNLGRPSYLTRLHEAHLLTAPTDIMPFGAGALVVGFPISGSNDPTDVLLRIDDPAVDVRLRLAGVSAVPGTFTTVVHAENLSVSHAMSATVKGNLPLNGPIYLGVSVSNGVCTLTAKTFSCEMGNLEPLPRSIQITIKTNGNSIGLVKVTSDTPDPIQFNNVLN